MSGRTPAEQKGFSPSNLLWRAQDPRYPAQQGSVVTGHFSPVGAEPTVSELPSRFHGGGTMGAERERI